MPAYLLTWNPERYRWKALPDLIEEVNTFGSVVYDWSCGRNTRLRPGDRAFLLRQGPDSRGIIGSGTVLDEPYLFRQWKGQRRTSVANTMYVAVEWEILVDEPLLKRNQLDKSPFRGVTWNTRISGISIDARIAQALEAALAGLSGLPDVRSADEMTTEDHAEGAGRRITVNAYERNRRARRDCIDHYGTVCVVCTIDLAGLYGPVASGFIHVHHIVPLSQIRRGYRVNGIEDLRPVCPNCHAVLHRRTPPYSIRDVQAMWKKMRSAAAKR
jgi:5-methylcytosine-specific restriction protein A